MANPSRSIDALSPGNEVISYPLGVAGRQTRVLQWGAGPRDILFLHGAGARADRWAGILRRLDPMVYRAVAIDFPGHGFATKGDAWDYTIPAFADMAADVIAALDMQRPALVGTSMGGHVAALLAVRDPEAFAGLCLVGSVGLVPIPAPLNQMIAGALVATGRDHVLMKLQAILCDKSLITESLVEAEWRINNSAGAAEGFSRLSRYWLERHAGDLVGFRLAALGNRPSIQLIWGAEDRTTPVEMGREAAEMLTDGKLTVLPGAGHAPYLDAPEAFVEAILPFLDRLPWGASAAPRRSR